MKVYPSRYVGKYFWSDGQKPTSFGTTGETSIAPVQYIVSCTGDSNRGVVNYSYKSCKMKEITNWEKTTYLEEVLTNSKNAYISGIVNDDHYYYESAGIK